MGKILTYLKISEDDQSRDVLDAERLLEGMQAIYATSPSGSKKDNFAIPLAEMTKIFIEKVKDIAPKEEPKEAPKEEIEFNIGDKYLNKTVKDTFTITQVYTDFIDVKFSTGIEATYDMLLCKERVADGTWVKVVDEEKEEPKIYKVGDKFLWAKEDMIFTIDFIKNGELGIIYSDGLTGFMSTEQFEKGLSTGYYKPYTEEAKPEEKKPRKPRQPRTKSEQDKKIEHILDINLDEIQF